MNYEITKKRNPHKDLSLWIKGDGSGFGY